VGVRWYHPRKIFENSDAKSCILVASALISGPNNNCCEISCFLKTTAKKLGTNTIPFLKLLLCNFCFCQLRLHVIVYTILHFIYLSICGHHQSALTGRQHSHIRSSLRASIGWVAEWYRTSVSDRRTFTAWSAPDLQLMGNHLYG